MTSKSEFMPPKNQKRLLRDVAKMIKNPFLRSLRHICKNHRCFNIFYTVLKDFQL